MCSKGTVDRVPFHRRCLFVTQCEGNQMAGRQHGNEPKWTLVHHQRRCERLATRLVTDTQNKASRNGAVPGSAFQGFQRDHSAYSDIRISKQDTRTRNVDASHETLRAMRSCGRWKEQGSESACWYQENSAGQTQLLRSSCLFSGWPGQSGRLKDYLLKYY